MVVVDRICSGKVYKTILSHIRLLVVKHTIIKLYPTIYVTEVAYSSELVNLL
jgi:hypothetical protein